MVRFYHINPQLPSLVLRSIAHSPSLTMLRIWLLDVLKNSCIRRISHLLDAGAVWHCKNPKSVLLWNTHPYCGLLVLHHTFVYLTRCKIERDASLRAREVRMLPLFCFSPCNIEEMSLDYASCIKYRCCGSAI